MAKAKLRRIEYQESGGGWGNPLMGRVFDSDLDIRKEELAGLFELCERCELPSTGKLSGPPSIDSPSFEISIEDDDRTLKVVGDYQQADEHLKDLISFIRKHSRKALLED